MSWSPSSKYLILYSIMELVKIHPSSFAGAENFSKTISAIFSNFPKTAFGKSYLYYLINAADYIF